MPFRDTISLMTFMGLSEDLIIRWRRGGERGWSSYALCWLTERRKAARRRWRKHGAENGNNDLHWRFRRVAHRPRRPELDVVTARTVNTRLLTAVDGSWHHVWTTRRQTDAGCDGVIGGQRQCSGWFQWKWRCSITPSTERLNHTHTTPAMHHPIDSGAPPASTTVQASTENVVIKTPSHSAS